MANKKPKLIQLPLSLEVENNFPVRVLWNEEEIFKCATELAAWRWVREKNLAGQVKVKHVSTKSDVRDQGRSEAERHDAGAV